MNIARKVRNVGTLINDTVFGVPMNSRRKRKSKRSGRSYKALVRKRKTRYRRKSRY